MRKSFCLIFAFVLFAPVALWAGTYEEEVGRLSSNIATNIEKSGKRTIAVVDFTDLQGNITELGRFVAEELSANLVSAGKGFQVVDRIHLKSILAEHKLSLSGLTDPNTTKKLGKIAGVDAIVIGTVTPFGDSVRISAKVITTDTAMVIGAATGNIAKTKAIEELLARGIEVARAPGAAPLKPKPIKKAVKTYVLGDLEFRFLKMKRAGNVVTIYVVATNNGKKEVKLRMYRKNCCLYDDLANKYDATRVCIGRHCTTGTAHDTVIPGVSMKVSADFKDIPPPASTATLEMEMNKGKVILRNLSLK